MTLYISLKISQRKGCDPYCVIRLVRNPVKKDKKDYYKRKMTDDIRLSLSNKNGTHSVYNLHKQIYHEMNKLQSDLELQ